jgi:hypothetical protein
LHLPTFLRWSLACALCLGTPAVAATTPFAYLSFRFLSCLFLIRHFARAPFFFTAFFDARRFASRQYYF